MTFFKGVLNFFGFVFGGPKMNPTDPELKVTFYLKGGQILTFEGAKEVNVEKRIDGSYSGYNITWHEGRRPALLSFILGDISAVVVEKM